MKKNVEKLWAYASITTYRVNELKMVIFVIDTLAWLQKKNSLSWSIVVFIRYAMLWGTEQHL